MDREPSNAEHTGVLGVVDWSPKNVPLGAVVSAVLPSASASPVASAIHTARQVRLQLGSKGSSRLSHQQQGQALAVASQQAVPVATCRQQQQHSATGVAASASGWRECLAARSSSNNAYCLALLAAAPARPATTFFGSLGLAVGEAAELLTGTGPGVVTLSNPSVDSVWVFTQALCAGVVWSASILIHIMRTMSKSAVTQRG